MTTLGHLLHRDTKHAWSFADITRLLQGRVRSLKMKFIDQEEHKDWTMNGVFGKSHNAAAILLTVFVPGMRRKQRHWVCLLRPRGKPIQFFDSLAMPLPELSALLKDDGKFVGFLKRIKAVRSTKRLQEDISTNKTCGAWVAVRAAFGTALNLTNAEFNHFILSEKGTKPDLTCMKLVAIGMLT